MTIIVFNMLQLQYLNHKQIKNHPDRISDLKPRKRLEKVGIK